MLGRPVHVRHILSAAALFGSLANAGSVLQGPGHGQRMLLFGFNALPILTRPLSGPGAADTPVIEGESVTFRAREGSVLHLLNSQHESKHGVRLQGHGGQGGGVCTLHHQVFEIAMKVALTERNLLLDRPGQVDAGVGVGSAVARFTEPTSIKVETGFILDPSSPVRLLVHPCFLFIAGICGSTTLHIPRTDSEAITAIIHTLIKNATSVVAEGTSSFFIGSHRWDVLTWRGFLGAWRGFAYTMVVLYRRLGKLDLLRALGDPPCLRIIRIERVGKWERQVLVRTRMLRGWAVEVRDWLARLNHLHARVEGEVREVDWDGISRASGGTTYEERNVLKGLWET